MSDLSPHASFMLRAEPAERALLSCLRLDLMTVAAMCVSAGLAALHFPTYGALYEAAIALWRDGRDFDALALPGPQETVLAAFYEPVWVGNADRYIQQILENHATRQLAEIGRQLTADAYTLPPTELLANVRAALDPLLSPRVRRHDLRDFLIDAVANIQSFSEDDHNAVEFGLGLDFKAGPFCRGDLVIIAGETGKGKSALAGNIVENVAGRGGVCAVMSLEMSGVQNVERMLASQGRVDVRSLKLRLRLRRGQETTQQDDNDLGRVQRAVEHMKDWKVAIVEQAESVLDIVSELTRIKAQHGALDLAVVDYAQLVAGIRAKGDSREREVASISRTLKIAATKLDCVALLLSQLNDEGRLRESRALGQDANCVLFLEENGVRVGKARSAPSGVEIKMDWHPQFTRFSEST